MARKRTSLTLEELGNNRDLYFKSCLKIVPKSAHGLIPLEMKKEQRRLMDEIDARRASGIPPRVVILKSRRLGMSTVTEAELFRKCHTKPLRQALVVAHSLDSADAIFRMTRTFYDNLPDSVRPPTKYSTKKLIQFGHNGSRMQVTAAGESRGFTAQDLHISELAFIDDADTLMTAILQTASDDLDSLIVVESTPNGLGNYFHNLWVNAVAGRNDWIPFFSPWFEDETYQATPWFTEEELLPADRELMRTHNLTLRQMAWYISTRENKCAGDQDVMDQEYASDPHSCFLASGSKVFDTEGLRHYMERAEEASKADPIKEPEIALPPKVEIETNPDDKRGPNIIVSNGGPWRIYRKPVPRRQYVVGADIASGEPHGDYTPLVVLCRHTLDVDAVFYARRPPEVLAAECARIAWWYNQAKVAPEGNNHGILFVHTLMRELKYTNVHYRKTSEESVAGRVTDRPGVLTTGANREHLFNLVRRYVRQRSGRCTDPDLIREWSELFYDENKRVDHPPKGYSDGTTALAFALYDHAGSFDATLTPLPPDVTSNAIRLYHENQVRRSMGIREKDIDIADLTMDEIQKLDDMAMARERNRARNGLGGYR